MRVWSGLSWHTNDATHLAALLVAALAPIIASIMALSLATSLAHAAGSAAQKPLPTETQSLLKVRALGTTAPIYIRIFKETSELEVWKARSDGRYLHIRTFPICTWSGTLGPKQALGDKMAPEGFYGFGADGLKPDSKYHLALNVGYPNTLDRALGRTGDFIMVHGQCVSVGCFAMTNDLIEEIYALAREALDGGAERIPVHIFPFRMTAENLKRHADNGAYPSWKPLKEAYDDFARTHEPPRIAVCGSRYVVNPLTPVRGSAKEACPTRVGKLLAPLSPRKAKKLALANTPLFADGPKTRTLDDIATFDPAAARAEFKVRDDAQKARRAQTATSADNGAVTPFLGTP